VKAGDQDFEGIWTELDREQKNPEKVSHSSYRITTRPYPEINSLEDTEGNPPTPAELLQAGSVVGLWIDHQMFLGPHNPLDGFKQIFLDDHVGIKEEKTQRMPDLEEIYWSDEEEEGYIWNPDHDRDPGGDDSESRADSSDWLDFKEEEEPTEPGF
jgi:hypothetical protein